MQNVHRSSAWEGYLLRSAERKIYMGGVSSLIRPLSALHNIPDVPGLMK